MTLKKFFSATPWVALGLAAMLALSACSKEADSSANSEADQGNTVSNVVTEEPATEPTKTGKEGETPLSLGEMVEGDPNAPIALIEYASVTCPHCANFHETIYPAIKEEFIDTGKVKLVYREFPTAPAQLSYIGFALARCSVDVSGNPESYFAMLGMLYKTQSKWISENFKPEILKIAAQAGMDEEAVNQCLTRQEIVDVINANIESGDKKYGVTGTPTFFIGDDKLQARTKDEFMEEIGKAVTAAGL